MGLKQSPDSGHPSIIILAVKDKAELQVALSHAREQGIKTFEFHEPYQDWGLTSFATESLPQAQRHHFSQFNLWRK